MVRAFTATTFSLLSFFTISAFAVELKPESVAKSDAYKKEIAEWRDNADKRLRRDNGWLTLAGRYVMKDGENTIGTGKDNAIVLPAGIGPERLGTVVVDSKLGNKGVTLKLGQGISMMSNEMPFEGERQMVVGGDKPDWVKLGRMQFQVIERNGRYVLRLADNESTVRSRFAGRVWFDTKDDMRVTGKYVPHSKTKMIPIVNVLDEITDTPSPGYIEFTLKGKKYKLDAVAEPKDKELFIILKDKTAGAETYGSGRFLSVEWPEGVKAKGGAVQIDLNKIYNPPCAFSEFTTCPLPPKQNIMQTRLEAGEQIRAKS
jgi:uncharacterized protein